MFLDEAVVEFASGRGGAGAVSFHREKHVPRGGPDGQNGGRGGDIILIADRGRRTLYDFKFQKEIRAADGSNAITHKSGKDGASVEIHVPVGTLVIDNETDEPIVDLASDGMRYVLCKGGRGGFGNLHYVSSVRQVPMIAQKGAPPEVIQARLELKLLADVGLIGLPNAGKSTLISRISAAKPKIADYPFTTIVPNLGVVSTQGGSFVVADMPGLIEGASDGRGLGHQFLRHVERCSVLVHLVDCFPLDETDPVANFELIEAELKNYSEALWNRPRIVAVNKVDIYGSADAPEVQSIVKSLSERTGGKVYAISGVSGVGLDSVVQEMARVLDEESNKPRDPIISPLLHKEVDLSSWDVITPEEGVFHVTGKRIERMIEMTNLGSEDSVRYLHRRLVRIGVIEKLSEMGAKEGDTVKFGQIEMVYSEDF